MGKSKRKKRHSMIKKESYSIQEVLSKTYLTTYGNKIQNSQINEFNNNLVMIDFDGDLINMTSQRYQLFKSRGTTCVKCGLEASFFRKERPFVRKNFDENKVKYHFNLYGVKDGIEVLFTKDHIIPKVKGGKNSLSNYQTMCQPCNQEKDDKIIKYEKI